MDSSSKIDQMVKDTSKNEIDLIYDLLFSKMKDLLLLAGTTNETSQLDKFLSQVTVITNINKDNRDDQVGETMLDIFVDGNSKDSDVDRCTNLRKFFSNLKENGIYILEDIDPESEILRNPGLISCYCKNENYFFAGTKKHNCIIINKIE